MQLPVTNRRFSRKTMPPRRVDSASAEWLLCSGAASTLCAILVSVAFSMVGGCSCARPVSSEIESCHLNLKILGEAIAAYRMEHDNCPPVVVGTTGRKHSWRTLILPYVLRRYDRGDVMIDRFAYRMDEDWDSEHNAQIVNSMPTDAFVCPTESRVADYPFTSYLMLVRPPNEAVTPLPADAVLLVESAYSGIRVAEPRDINWETLWTGKSPFGKGKLNSQHFGVVKAMRVDGTIIDIPKDISVDDLRRLLNGGVKNQGSQR